MRADHTILSKAPVGALIQTVSGPLFLTISDELTGLEDNAGELKVKVSIGRAEGAPVAASPKE